MEQNYDDIIGLSHHRSTRHPPLSSTARAAQFSPFAALTGHSAAIREAARLTDRQIELDEDEKVLLDQKLRALIHRIDQCPDVTVTYFLPDAQKSGGAYVTVAGQLKRFDALSGTLTLCDGTSIPIHRILSVE